MQGLAVADTLREEKPMLKVGERVFARKGQEDHWYTGTIRHVDGERFYVIFDDGDDALLESKRLKSLDLHIGDQVFARLPMELEFKPGRIVAWDDDKVRLHWADGGEDWTSYGMIRWQPNVQIKALTAPAEECWTAGDRVFACWHDLFWYPAVILTNNGDKYHVILDNGNQALVSGERMRRLHLEAGDKILARWKGGPEYYGGEIASSNGEVIHIHYDDGDEEMTSVRLVRLQRDEWFPPAGPASVQEGDRVLACWFDFHWYPGVVLTVDGQRIHVFFDDGDQATLTPDKVRPLDIKVGDRLFCRYKGGPAYYPGEVMRKRGEVIRIHYDDGDEETTSIRLVRIAGTE
jgi:hypothetical protein